RLDREPNLSPVIVARHADGQPRHLIPLLVLISIGPVSWRATATTPADVDISRAPPTCRGSWSVWPPKFTQIAFTGAAVVVVVVVVVEVVVVVVGAAVVVGATV